MILLRQFLDILDSVKDGRWDTKGTCSEEGVARRKMKGQMEGRKLRGSLIERLENNVKAWSRCKMEEPKGRQESREDGDAVSENCTASMA